MAFSLKSNIRVILFYLLLVSFACLPILSVENFVNQDGSPHLYNSYIILEILRGNPSFTQIYALNPAPLPNLTGHWLIAFFLLFLSPLLITKLTMILTFAGFVAAVGWLRWQIAGKDGLLTALLFGTVLAFNWMWLLGFYNFIIGVIGFIFTLGLYWRWREILNLPRSIILSILIILIFFSHLISFLVLAGSLFVLSAFVSKAGRKQAIGWTTLMMLPVLPFIVGYKLLTADAGGATFPVWRYLSDPFSMSSWIMQLQTADPFQILSRKVFPFISANSGFFALFTPTLWISAAVMLLLIAAWFGVSRKEIFSRQSLPFMLLGFSSLLFWIFAPDDFGKSHGSFLRERILLCGLIFFVPLFKTENSKILRHSAHFLLAFVIIFQTAVLWEYSLNADRLAKEYLSGKDRIADTDLLGTIDLIENGCRYKLNPLSNMAALYGVGKNTRIWDNYEIGYYQFPVIAKSPSDRQFVFDFRQASTFELCDVNENTAEKIAALNSLLDLHHDKISVMLV
ncbi:MAG: hypothetical protein ABIP06_01825, partial [Pyrinomonadaceae bacterium]